MKTGMVAIMTSEQPGPRARALFGPEEESVVAVEDQEGEQECGGPLARGGRWFAAREHPEVEREAGSEEAHGGEEEGRNLVDSGCE